MGFQMYGTMCCFCLLVFFVLVANAQYDFGSEESVQKGNNLQKTFLVLCTHGLALIPPCMQYLNRTAHVKYQQETGTDIGQMFNRVGNNFDMNNLMLIHEREK